MLNLENLSLKKGRKARAAVTSVWNADRSIMEIREGNEEVRDDYFYISQNMVNELGLNWNENQYVTCFNNKGVLVIMDMTEMVENKHFLPTDCIKLSLSVKQGEFKNSKKGRNSKLIKEMIENREFGYNEYEMLKKGTHDWNVKEEVISCNFIEVVAINNEEEFVEEINEEELENSSGNNSLEEKVIVPSY